MTQELKKELLRLLKEDEEFRYAVVGLLGLEEILRRFDRHEEELVRLREDMNRGFARYDSELAKLREDMNKGFERYDRELVRLREDMNRGFAAVEKQISALGARWGIMAESAFRAGLKEIIERYFGGKVTKWGLFDREGFVYGSPAVVEADVLVRDREHLLVEVKSSVSKGDVIELKRISELYERETGVRPKLVIVSPFVDERALELARHFGIEVYSVSEVLGRGAPAA
ncbi:MAG: DUF3782 domain-containing protein [Thaumarchaeota archaeon]|nr:DUF3782 domain-containing protein [Candidatus Calditenuaceae archaeon]MDW8042357.1 DUF3782 domain-containing protein [Nitrososphaerota archaeon]